ncbi:hypothetical protein [Streptomyces sp. NPDC016845]|uniref:hypothetical protein n=1 Tax=Streptomyces sp. NPDC016845 TaxID=3364972 RepID=UPI0037BCD6E4
MSVPFGARPAGPEHTDAYAVRPPHTPHTPHTERTALRTYRPSPHGSRSTSEPDGATTPSPTVPPAASTVRHDHRDGGRGRFPARRRRDRSTHKQAAR